MSELLHYILSTEESFRRARLPSLYSDFARHRHTNPDGYASNVSAWQRALAKAARAGYLPSSSRRPHASAAAHATSQASRSNLLVMQAGNALVAALETSEWGRPVALQSVVDESVAQSSMIPLHTFLSSTTSPFRRSWIRIPGPPSLSQVASWGMKQVRGLIIGGDEDHIESSGRLQEQDLVLVDNLKEAATSLETVVSSRNSSTVDRIYSKEMFMKEFAHIFGDSTELSTTDFDVLLIFLSRDQNRTLYDGSTVKFKSTDGKTDTITHEDRTIASLKTIISNLTQQIAKLDAKIREYTLAAQNALNNKNRILALSALRSKKLAEQNLTQRADTLLQLEEVFTKLEKAADQVEIVRVMQASTLALRTLHAQTGGVEKVEDVVEELRQEMANVEEVTNVISDTGQVVDEGELDEELQAMEAAEREAAEKRGAEKREAEKREAEITRQRLAELDRIAKGRAEKEADLEESIGRLSNMSLEDGSRTRHAEQEKV